MQTPLHEAEFAKEREALFHKQTESMHSATLCFGLWYKSVHPAHDRVRPAIAYSSSKVKE